MSDPDFDPPIYLGDFANEEGDDVCLEQQYTTKQYTVNNITLDIREYAYSPTNAGFVWPATYILCKWVEENITQLQNKRIFELGSGTGVLKIGVRCHKQRY
eukprot:TRINITY_DN2590_c0_g1_i2.p1 TRINITY_DN2590_c0_g1~~TRINITY_DN2590_c0_g1_i2.p1  ORF type:complete len:101 (-),score=13.79 TRINITY_DN2590_c0_g1_i2:341-643(-)